MLYQLTRPQNMTNAKLVAEYHSVMDILDNQKTGWTYPLVRMDRRSNIVGELVARAELFEAVYCYENHIEPKIRAYRVENEADATSLKSKAEYQRAAQSDGMILIHWAYSYELRDKIPLPTPPADPGTAGGTSTLAATTPAAPAAKTVGGFSDVLESSGFAQPVVWAVGKGITTGMPDGTFAPGTTCTQAQILTFLWRAKGQPEPKGTVEMEGFDGSEYYYKAAQWAAEQGLIGGEFDPGAPCTRSTAMMYMWKRAGSPNAAAASFTDVSSGADYAPAVNWAVAKGVTTGVTSNTFAPENPCTRGQIVTFLYRAFK